MTLESVFYAVVLIGLLMLAGKMVRRHVKVLQKLFLPSSIVGGIIGLLLGPEVLGRSVAAIWDTDAWLAGGIWPAWVLEVWSGLPKLLISVVFAALFLGKEIPSIRKIWRRAGPMVAHGQTMAWGQYVVGLLLAILVLVPVWDVSPMSGALIEIGFEGGHGTAAGLAGTFRDLGFEDGADLALGLATIGVVAGVLLGTAAINWGIWRGHIRRPDEVRGHQPSAEAVSEHENREPGALAHFTDRALEPLSIHLGFVGLSIGVGWLLLQGLILLEAWLLVPLGWPQLMTYIPLFPLAMIGGVIVQIAGGPLRYGRLIDRGLMNRISGTSLDLLVVAAMAALSLAALGANIWVFLLLALGGILWNIFGLVVLAPRMFPREDWMPNGLANFGQGMAMTVVGLLLVRMSDPQNRTGAMEAFGYKQLLFEPIVGGGLFTAASLPLINQFGAVPVLIGVSVVMLGWLIFGLLAFGRRGRAGDVAPRGAEGGVSG